MFHVIVILFKNSKYTIVSFVNKLGRKKIKVEIIFHVGILKT